MRTALSALLLLVAAPALAGDKDPPAAAAGAPAAKQIEIKVTDAGFEPREVTLKKGETVNLVFTRVTDDTCIRAIDIPDENVKGLELPLKRPVTVALTPKKAGVQPFHCSAMGMGDGKLVVRE